MSRTQKMSVAAVIIGLVAIVNGYLLISAFQGRADSDTEIAEASESEFRTTTSLPPPASPSTDTDLVDWETGIASFPFGLFRVQTDLDRGVLYATGTGHDELTQDPLGYVPVAAIDLDTGDVLWENQIERGYDSDILVASSDLFVLAIRDDFFGPDVPSRVIAIEPDSGAIRWQFEADSPTMAATVDQATGALLVGEWDGDIHTVDAATGESLATLSPPAGADSPIRQLVTVGNQIYVEAGMPASRLSALTVTAGAIMPAWTLDLEGAGRLTGGLDLWAERAGTEIHSLWSPEAGRRCEASSPCLDATIICVDGGRPAPFFRPEDRQDRVLCLQAESGLPLWSESARYAVPIGSADGNLIVVMEQDIDAPTEVRAFDAANGDTAWSTQLAVRESPLARGNRLAGGFFGELPYVVRDGLIAVASAREIVVLESATGDPVLMLDAGSGSMFAPGLTESHLFANWSSDLGDRALIAADLSTGELSRWDDNELQVLSSGQSFSLMQRRLSLVMDRLPLELTTEVGQLSLDEEYEAPSVTLGPGRPSADNEVGEEAVETTSDELSEGAECETFVPTWDDVANRSYNSDIVGEITVVDGSWSMDVRSFTVFEDLILFEDINDDCLTDAVVVSQALGGGSGAFLRLHTLLSNGSALVSSGYVELGDRTQVDSLEVTGEGVSVTVLEHGPNDGLCCPTVPTVIEFAFTRLVEGTD